MNQSIKNTLLCVLAAVTFVQQMHALVGQKRPKVLIVLGSARENSVSQKIAHALEKMIDPSVDHEIIDLQDLPLIDPNVPRPHSLVERWKKNFSSAAAVIFLVPNYNAGYSGVLKNALDALGDDIGQGKTVGLIAYSGGYDGGKEAVDALMPVIATLKMQVVDTPVLIPMADSAFDGAGMIKKPDTQKAFAELLNKLYNALNK